MMARKFPYRGERLERRGVGEPPGKSRLLKICCLSAETSGLIFSITQEINSQLRRPSRAARGMNSKVKQSARYRGVDVPLGKRAPAPAVVTHMPIPEDDFTAGHLTSPDAKGVKPASVAIPDLLDLWRVKGGLHASLSARRRGPKGAPPATEKIKWKFQTDGRIQ